MPPTVPIVDLTELDLTKDVYSKEDVLRHCKQRGRFELVDGVTHFDREQDFLVGYKDLREDDWWAQDHIPGRPIYPGILMTEGCGQLCTFHYLKSRADDRDIFIGYGGLNNTRFRGVVEPGCRFHMVGKVMRQRKSMFIYHAQGVVDGSVVFETEIIGVVL